MITCATSIGMFIVVTALHTVTAKMPKKMLNFLVFVAPYLFVKIAKSSKEKSDATNAEDEAEKKQNNEDTDDVEKQKTAANGRVDNTRDSMKAARESFFALPPGEATTTTDVLLQAMLIEMQKTRELTEEIKAGLAGKNKGKESDEGDGGSGNGSGSDADDSSNPEDWLLMALVIDRVFFIVIAVCFFIGALHFFANSVSAKPHIPAGIDS